MDFQLLVICGMARSGTSILRNVMDSHLDMRVLYEARIFHLETSYPGYAYKTLKRLFRTPGADHKREVVLFLLFLLRQVLERGGLTHLEIRSALKSTFPRKRLVGDKYPGYWRQIAGFAAWEDTQIVYIYRDCRDVVASNLQMVGTAWKNQLWTTNHDTPEKIAKKWVNAMDLMGRYEDRLITVCYEEMVQDPYKVMKSLANRLELDVDQFDLSAVHSSSIGKHKTDLSANQLDSILAIAGSTLRKLRYV